MPQKKPMKPPIGTSKESTQDSARLDLIFHVLADATRRAILLRLTGGPCRVGELAADFKISAPAISKHLRVIEKAGLLSRRVKGRIHECHLEAEALREIRSWIDHYESFWNGNLNALENFAAQEKRSNK